MQENPQKIDPDSGLPFCVFHNDRVEHFYCEAHKVLLRWSRLQGAEFALKLVILKPTATCLTSTTFPTLRNIWILSKQGYNPEIYLNHWLSITRMVWVIIRCLTWWTTMMTMIWTMTAMAMVTGGRVFDLDGICQQNWINSLWQLTPINWCTSMSHLSNNYYRVCKKVVVPAKLRSIAGS